MYKCKYCGKEFEKVSSVAAHTSHCKLNPTSTRTSESNRAATIKGRETYKQTHPEMYIKKEFQCNCIKCGTQYAVYKTQLEMDRGQYPKHCTLTCANTRVISEETKNKIRNSFKTSEKVEQQRKASLKNYSCKECGKTFTMDDDRNTTGRQYCSQECKDKWLKENLYSKSGGYRKGSGRGKSGWYKGIHCDSSWELAYVIYHLDHGLNIKRCTQKREYIFNNQKHYFFPDFEVSTKIVEIKGYNSEQWEAKIQQNPDVQVLYKEEMKPYLEYVIDKYGNDFINLYDDSNPKTSIDNKKFVWLHNNEGNVYITVDKYEEYISKGYVRGRSNKFYKTSKQWNG